MSEANDPAFWNHLKLVELADKCRRDFERVLAAASGWKPNREFQERPPEGRHVQFATRTGVYVGQRSAEGNWKDALWGRGFTDADVSHWAPLLGAPV